MDTLPLPPRPNLEQYKKRAKDLVAAATSPDETAVQRWAEDWLTALAKSLDTPITQFVQHSFDRAVAGIVARVADHSEASNQSLERFNLASAHFVIAQAHGFANWSDFADQVGRRPVSDQPFELAVDAVVAGDLAALERLLDQHPELIRAQSVRVHHATLLHYVAANGVEDFRQRTPENAVAIARTLLNAGAEVDAVADTYGGGRIQTTMNLLVSSTHPADAGLQSQLVETLLDFGAAIEGLDNDSSPMMTALAFGYVGAAETLSRRGARVDNVVAAAALGRADLVGKLVVDGRTLTPEAPLVSPVWVTLPNNAEAHIQLALVWACKFGRSEVAHLLLDRGVSPTSKDSDDMTVLHWCGASGLTDVATRLIAAGVPLEVRNHWGGTVLTSTLHFALYMPRSGVDYVPIVRLLVAAGADTTQVDPFPTGDERIDEALATPRGTPVY